MISTLSGFTLFKVPKGWQLSTRDAGEEGWQVRLVTPEQADLILQAAYTMVASAAPPPPKKPEQVTGRLNLHRDRVRL